MTRTAPSGQTRSPTNYQMRLSSDLRANSLRCERNWTSMKFRLARQLEYITTGGCGENR